jgi:hypothetical protein
MAFSIYHNARTDRQYKAATGLSQAQFEQLYQLFAPFYTPKAPLLYGTATPVLTNKREALFFILHYYKAYPTLHNMSLYFGFSDFAVSHYVERLKPCLKAALQAQGLSERTVFTNQAHFEEVFAGIDDLVIDVTEVPIERASDQQLQEEFYSGKKNGIPSNGC